MGGRRRGGSFWDLNKEPLRDYAACKTSAEVVKTQWLYMPDEEE